MIHKENHCTVYAIKSQEDMDEKVAFLRTKLKFSIDSFEANVRLGTPLTFERVGGICCRVNGSQLGWLNKSDIKKQEWKPCSSWEEFCKDLGIATQCQSSKCTCDRTLMFYQGCKCGAFQRELENENF